MLTKSDKDVIEYAVYKPHGLYSSKLDHDQCARGVAETGRGVSFYQCNRKGKKELGGYKWCDQHYKELARTLNLEPDEPTQTMFYATLEYGNVGLVQFQVTTGTKTYQIVSRKSLLGGLSFYYKKSVQKSDENLFTSRGEALKHLSKLCVMDVANKEKALTEARTQWEFIRKLIAEGQKK